MKSSVSLLLVVIGSILSQTEALLESFLFSNNSYIRASLHPNPHSEIGMLPYVSEEQVEKYEEKCREVGGEEAVRKGKKASDNLLKCSRTVFDINMLVRGIYANQGNGKYGTTFKNFCSKNQSIKQCLLVFLDADPCLTEEEKSQRLSAQRIVDLIYTVICHDGGEGIASFMEEGGPECLKSKQQEIEDCGNSDSENSLIYVCLELPEVEECYLKTIKTCQNPSLTMHMRSILNGFRKAFHCLPYSEDSISVASKIGNIFSSVSETVISTFITLVALVNL